MSKCLYLKGGWKNLGRQFALSCEYLHIWWPSSSTARFAPKNSSSQTCSSQDPFVFLKITEDYLLFKISSLVPFDWIFDTIKYTFHICTINTHESTSTQNQNINLHLPILQSNLPPNFVFIISLPFKKSLCNTCHISHMCIIA